MQIAFESIPGLGLAVTASGGCMQKWAVAAVAAGSSAAGVTDVDGGNGAALVPSWGPRLPS